MCQCCISYAVGLVLNSFHSYPCYLQSSRSLYRLTKDLTVERGKTRAPPKSQDFSDISRWNSGIALILLALTESGVAGQSGSATPQKMRIAAELNFGDRLRRSGKISMLFRSSLPWTNFCAWFTT